MFPQINKIMNLDSSEVWLPPHSSDFGLGDKKSHFWQNAPVTDWSKEQVRIFSFVTNLIIYVW